jgi:Fe-S-cluster containining protein
MVVQSSTASPTDSFGYICHRCSRCCRNKHIQLTPYEVARLARARNESTSEFRAAWTIDGQGTALRQKEDGTCVFLGPQGCEVHTDRPLVCRLYPLARHVDLDGTEHYTVLEGHPLSEGEFTKQGKIADYLAAQGATPYMSAHDSYFQWLHWAHKKLDLALEASVSKGSEGADDSGLLDMDSMITRYCATTGKSEPDNIDDRLQLHLQALYAVVVQLEVQHDEANRKVGEDRA